jgi:3-deoxy-manno-octulosonate cytidylyltransferase (CMP-KDO synthetase)
MAKMLFWVVLLFQKEDGVMKIIGVIPARYASSRFPGKPLADIHGKPMIWWVYQTAVMEIADVIIATDDNRIMEVCEQLEIKAALTLKSHRTGVDRLAEVAESIAADYYLLIQGDEPLIEGKTIRTMVEIIARTTSKDEVFTFRAPISNPVDAVNSTIIKVVANTKNRVLFASRSAIPYPKESVSFQYYKSVGVYAYPRAVLLKWKSLRSASIESVEEHDFMRLLENEIIVRAFPIDTSTISVDTPKDLERVRQLFQQQTKE